MRVLKYGPGPHDLDARAVLTGAIQPFEARDLAIFRRDQERPVEARGRQAPAECRGVIERVAEPTRVDEQLLRHAAANDTRPSEPVLLGEHDFGAVRRCDARSAMPPDPAPITNRSTLNSRSQDSAEAVAAGVATPDAACTKSVSLKSASNQFCVGRQNSDPVTLCAHGLEQASVKTQARESNGPRA